MPNGALVGNRTIAGVILSRAKGFFALPTQNCLAKLHKILNFVKIIGRLLSCSASEKQTQACNTKSGHGSWTRTSARKFAFGSAISLFSQRFFK